MTKYKTISVPADVKDKLDKVRNGKEWGKFLEGLYNEVERMRGKEAFDELADELSDEDLKKIKESSKEFRERFELRC